MLSSRGATGTTESWVKLPESVWYQPRWGRVSPAPVPGPGGGSDVSSRPISPDFLDLVASSPKLTDSSLKYCPPKLNAVSFLSSRGVMCDDTQWTRKPNGKWDRSSY
jgi:hypothetical protein